MSRVLHSLAWSAPALVAVAAFAARGRDKSALLVVFQRARRNTEALGGVAYGQKGRRVGRHGRWHPQ